MTDLVSPQEIAARLRELQRTSPTERADLEAWDASARSFWSELAVPLPIGVMHYLHDADIRIKDSAYRASQDEMIKGILSDLEQGIIPESTSRTISFHPRWLGAIALALLALLYLLVRGTAA